MQNPSLVYEGQYKSKFILVLGGNANTIFISEWRMIMEKDCLPENMHPFDLILRNYRDRHEHDMEEVMRKKNVFFRGKLKDSK